MAYRKIQVDGKPYEYTVGRTHVKVRHMGAVPKDQVGVPVCTSGADSQNPGNKTSQLKVSPADVANWIQKQTASI
jgi:hypothetical protein